MPSYARWLVPLVVVVAVLSPGSQVGYGLVGLGLGAAMTFVNVYNLASAGLYVRGHELYYRQRGSERLIGRAGELRVALIRVRGAAHPEWQIWKGGDGVVALVEQAWGAAELRGLAQQLGADVVSVSDPVSMREVAERYPETLPWYAKHPLAASIVLAVGVMGLLVLIDLL